MLQEVKDELRQNPNLAYGYANAFQKRGYPGIAIELFETAEEKRSNSNYLYQKALLYGEVGDIKKMYAAYVDMVESQASYLNTVKQLLGRAMQGETDSENTQYLKETLIKRIQDGGPETLNELLVFIFIKEKNFSGAFTQLKALDKRTVWQ
ncbi:MAG: hypothetical protein U5L96_18335 [Owenweeksia sp.]|nr:hypothetical protein [Owenweeksia sp.]